MVAVGGSCLRIAIISDTHFGDPLGTLVTASPKEPTPTIGPAYAPFARAVGRVDYLATLGAGFSKKIEPLSISSGPKFSSTRAGQECDPCPFAAKTSIPSRRSKGGGKYEGRPFEAWGPDRTTPREGGAKPRSAE